MPAVRGRIEVDPDLEPVPVPAAILNEVFAHAREAEPEECCGLITGADAAPFLRVVRCRNEMTRQHQLDPASYPRDGTQGFYMNEQDYLSAEEEAVARGERITCVYHSHVEAGAYFSEMDQDFADQPLFPFPRADHLVVAVVAGKVVDPAIFRREPGVARFVGRSVVHGA
jgi:adenylyltransferase/sulfurtransferase